MHTQMQMIITVQAFCIDDQKTLYTVRVLWQQVTHLAFWIWHSKEALDDLYKPHVTFSPTEPLTLTVLGFGSEGLTVLGHSAAKSQNRTTAADVSLSYTSLESLLCIRLEQEQCQRLCVCSKESKWPTLQMSRIQREKKSQVTQA